jgi:preprotein translocase subunit YajC
MNQNTLLVVYVGVMLGAMYFLFIAPQRKQRKQIAEMLAALQPGDEIITAGGVYGRLVTIDDDPVKLEIADGVVIRIAKAAVVGRKGEEKASE